MVAQQKQQQHRITAGGQRLPPVATARHTGAATAWRSMRRAPALSAAAVAPGVAEALAAAQATPSWDVVCALLSAVGGLIWVKLFKQLAIAGAMDKVGRGVWTGVHLTVRGRPSYLACRPCALVPPPPPHADPPPRRS